jgi:hypothetical protein
MAEDGKLPVLEKVRFGELLNYASELTRVSEPTYHIGIGVRNVLTPASVIMISVIISSLDKNDCPMPFSEALPARNMIDGFPLRGKDSGVW